MNCMGGCFQLCRTCLAARRHLRAHGPAAMLILFSIAALSVKANEQDSFIPRQATVILMSSLAGDVESENAYRDQLQAWLDIVATSNARRTIVLCDAPEPVLLPANSEKTALQPGAGNFLGLAAMLAGETNPLVVIAW